MSARAFRAFTVIEALVVTAVTATLLALVVPAMSSVRMAARTASCQSNLRQLSLATSAYAAQYKDRYPAAIVYEMTAAGVVTKAWDFERGADGTVRGGAIWTFADGPEEVQQCPEFLGASTFGNDPYTGYNYNTTFIGAEGRFPELGADGVWRDGWNVARRGLASGQLRNTTTCALFGDGGWKGGANKFMRAPENSVENDVQTIYAGGQAFRHAHCSCVAYLDGHVACVRDGFEGAHANETLLRNIMNYPANGFLADDDRPYDPR